MAKKKMLEDYLADIQAKSQTQNGVDYRELMHRIDGKTYATVDEYSPKSNMRKAKSYKYETQQRINNFSADNVKTALDRAYQPISFDSDGKSYQEFKISGKDYDDWNENYRKNTSPVLKNKVETGNELKVAPSEIKDNIKATNEFIPSTKYTVGWDGETSLGEKNKQIKDITNEYISKYGYLSKDASDDEKFNYYKRFLNVTNPEMSDEDIKKEYKAASIYYGIPVLGDLTAFAQENLVPDGGGISPVSMLARENEKNTGNAFTKTVKSLAGNMIGLGLNPGNLGTQGQTMLNVADDISSAAANKILGKYANSTLGKVGEKALQGTIDGSIGGVLDTLRDEDSENLKNNVVQSAFGGAIFSGGSEALGKGISKLKELKNTKVDIPDASKIDVPKVETKLPDSPALSKVETPKTDNVKEHFKPMNIENDSDKLSEVVKATSDEIASSKVDERAFTQLEDNMGLSRHATETMQNSENITPEFKEVLKQYEIDYFKTNNQADYDRAVEFAKKNNSVMEYLMSDGTSSQDTANGIALIQKLQKEGRFEEALDVTNKLTKDLTKGGQQIQAARILNAITPEGRLKMAVKEVNNNADKYIKKKGLKNTIDKEVKEISDILKDSKKSDVETVIKELTAEEKLAKKVNSHLNNGKPKTTSDEQILINTLYETARKTLPEKAAKLPDDPMKFVVKALENKEEYKEVWGKAKGILAEKYGDKPEMLEKLNSWFNQEAKPIFSENKANRVIANALKENQVDLGKVVRGYYNGDATEDITEYIIEKSGLSGENAAILGDYITQRMDELSNLKREQIIKTLLKDTKKGSKRKTLIEKLSEYENLGVLDDDKIRNLVLAKHDIPSLTGDDARYITEKMQEFQKADDEGKKIINAQIKKLINSKLSKSKMGIFNDVRYLNMLFNPKTLIKNAAGNMVNSAGALARDIIAKPIDNLVSKKTGNKTIFRDNSGVLSDVKNAAGKVIEDYKLGIDRNNPDFINNLENVPVVGKMNKGLHTALRLGDDIFKDSASNSYIRGYMKDNNITDISQVPAHILEEANLKGLEATFQQDSNIFGSGGNKANGVINFIKNIEMPFTKTPGNILDTAINYTPAGAVRGAFNIGKAIAGKGDNLFRTQRQGVEQLASGLVGTGLIGAGYGLAESGLLTGQLSDDYDTSRLQQQAGMQDYSIKVGDTYNNIDFAQPIATPLQIGADLSNGEYADKNIYGAIMEGAKTGINSLFGNSFLSNAKNLGKAIGEENYGAIPELVATDTLKQLVPLGSLASNITKTIDPAIKDTYDKDLWTKTINQVKAKYPNNLPQKVDSLGQPMEYNEGFGTAMHFFNNFINPLNTSKFTPTDVEKKALEMYEKDGSTKQMPRQAPDSFTYGGGKKYVVSDEEKRMYSEMLGKYLAKAKANPDDYYKAMSEAYDEWKQKVMKSNRLK